MNLLASIKSLCTPAYVYFVISMIFLVIVMIQNYDNVNIYCVGDFSCNVENTTLIFIVKFIYILFWTWILSLICNAGYRNISWFLVIFPFVFMLILIGLLVTSN